MAVPGILQGILYSNRDFSLMSTAQISSYMTSSGAGTLPALLEGTQWGEISIETHDESGYYSWANYSENYLRSHIYDSSGGMMFDVGDITVSGKLGAINSFHILNMTTAELRSACDYAGIDDTGTHADLELRLLIYTISHAADIAKAIGKALNSGAEDGLKDGEGLICHHNTKAPELAADKHAYGVVPAAHKSFYTS